MLLRFHEIRKQHRIPFHLRNTVRFATRSARQNSWSFVQFRMTGRPQIWSFRDILDGIFYIVRGENAWPLIPHDLPP